MIKLIYMLCCTLGALSTAHGVHQDNIWLISIGSLFLAIFASEALEKKNG